MEIELLIRNISELLPMKSNGKALSGKELSNIEVIENGAIAIKDETIIAVGSISDVLDKCTQTKNTMVIDGRGKTVLPGFVDCHTHLVFGTTRENEFVSRIEKLRNTQNVIMEGGIKFTVSKTRSSSKDKLIKIAKKHLDIMLSHGITTIESKSGYGLDLENEIKILEVNDDLRRMQDVEIETTFLGAHAIPEGYTSEQYVSLVINEMIPEVSKRKLAKFCDVFCEEGFFSRDEAKRILEAGKKHGLIPKIHADQLTNCYASSLAADVGANSADHLEYAYDDGLRAMAEKGVIGVLLPTISFNLDLQYPDAKKMIDLGVPIAISTDFNPGAGYCESMAFVIHLACLKLKMMPLEALAAATINGAYATGVADKVGSLKVGKQADIVIMNAPNHKHIPYHYGVNLVDTVIKKGKIVRQNMI